MTARERALRDALKIRTGDHSGDGRAVVAAALSVGADPAFLRDLAWALHDAVESGDAGVEYSTWWRWTQGTSPTVRTVQKLLAVKRKRARARGAA